MLERLCCRLFGCLPNETVPACDRCGYAAYDEEFVVWGLLAPVFRLRSWLASFTWPRCHQCKRRMFWRRLLRLTYDRELCSARCHDDWIPF